MDEKILKRQHQAMSDSYWKLWNDDEQKKIDRDIEKNRKADGRFLIKGLKSGTEVKVEQTKHKFVFGSHIFNFDQLGSDEANRRYKTLFGSLFNSATIAFYWSGLELEEGHPRFAGEYRDTADYWKKVPFPKCQPHWRRPATDPVVEFCRKKGIRLHGHTLVWGSNSWQIPAWLIAKMPQEVLNRVDLSPQARNGKYLNNALYPAFGELTPEEFAARYPEFTAELNTLIAERIYRIAMRYGNVIDSWDVVNESSTDYSTGCLIPGAQVTKSWYGPMPGDYVFRGFKLAESIFPDTVKLNINDWNMGQEYLDLTENLRQRGCKVDIMGAQMHLFNPDTCLAIAEGRSEEQNPKLVRDIFARLGKANLPIHLSEITITSPETGDGRGEDIQAVITRNLYRLWFSLKPMMGITWWNAVDDCGAPGEPSISGLFHRDMTPKQSFFALDDLINHEWKTDLAVKSGKDGAVEFRGFRGSYRLTWEDAKGVHHRSVTLE